MRCGGVLAVCWCGAGVGYGVLCGVGGGMELVGLRGSGACRGGPCRAAARGAAAGPSGVPVCRCAVEAWPGCSPLALRAAARWAPPVGRGRRGRGGGCPGGRLKAGGLCGRLRAVLGAGVCLGGIGGARA